MELMTAGFEIPEKKKSDDVMFDVSLHGNPFSLVPAMYTSCCLFYWCKDSTKKTKIVSKCYYLNKKWL